MKEFAIWGIPPDKKEEILLHTRAESIQEAKAMKAILENNFGCRKVRIQVVDMTTPPDFTKAITI